MIEMRRTMIPLLLLATVALSTGVVLPCLPPLQPGPDPVSDQSSDSRRPLTECEVLRKLFRSKSNLIDGNQLRFWKMFGYDRDNNQEDYGYLNKGQGVSDDGSLGDSWLSYPRQFYQPDAFIRNIFYQPYPYANDAAEKPEYDRPNMQMLYVRNNDILIRDDKAYYEYDSYMATLNAFDYFTHNQYNCLPCYNTMPQPSLQDEPLTDLENLELQEEQERLETNEITPLAKPVMDKRYDTSDIGEKEIPDNLVFNEGDKGEVQKKLFSFWSRLQALSHKGRQVPTRRHSFVYYGPDDTRDGPLTAETRASHLRPPGQPLRWG